VVKFFRELRDNRFAADDFVADFYQNLDVFRHQQIGARAEFD
jgi:hypothetical protein